jgi:hypothetical protein
MIENPEREFEQPDEVPEDEKLDVEGPNESAPGHHPEPEDKAEDKSRAVDEAKKKVKQLEQDPPEKLEDWPDDEAKYETFGGPEGEHSYNEGPEAQLGPSDVRHFEDGKVTVEGEEAENPEEYKGEPIPGGPTDESD